MLKLLTLLLSVMFVLGCYSEEEVRVFRAETQHKAEAWAENLSGTISVVCEETGPVVYTKCTIFREGKEPISIECSMAGCHLPEPIHYD